MPPAVSTTSSADHRFATFASIFVVSVLFASNMIIARWAAGKAPPFGMAFWRWTITAVFLASFTWREIASHRAMIARNGWRIALCGFLGMGLCGSPVYIAAAMTQAVNIGLIMAVSPAMVFFGLMLFRKESLPWHLFLSLTLCLFGVIYILCRGDFHSLARFDLARGDTIVFFAMLSWAGYTIIQGSTLKALSAASRIALFAAAGALLNLPFHLWELTRDTSWRFNSEMLGIFLFVGMFPGLAAYWLYAKLVDRAGAARTSLMMYLVPIANAILARLFLGESFASWHFVGALFVFTGLVLATWRFK